MTGRLGLVVALLALSLASAACGRCLSRQDCDPGFYCEFDRGECLQGCTGPEDCAPTASCDRQTGQCRPAGGSLFDRDAGTSTTATTASDAGA